MRKGRAGFVIPIILFLLMLLSAICLSSYSLARKAAELSSTRRHAENAGQRASFKILEKQASSGASDFTSGISCKTQQEIAGQGFAERTLCSIFNPKNLNFLAQKIIDGQMLPGGEFFPSFDYNKIFLDADACSLNLHSGDLHSAFGFALSPGAQLSTSTCSSSASQLQDFVVRSNLALNQNLVLRGTLAATGYIDLRGQVTLSAPTLIFAGGDLYIEHLLSNLPTGPAVTLISSSGVIQVKDLSPGLQLKAIAWTGAFLGAGSQAQPLPYLPELLELKTLGFAK